MWDDAIKIAVPKKYVSVKVCPEDEIATKGGGINAMNHAL